MSNLECLFEQRSRLGRERQPRHAHILDALDSRLPPEKTPFDEADDVSEALIEAPEFRAGSVGDPARLREKKYLYRFSSTGGLVKYCGWDSGRRPVSNRVAHRKLMVASEEGRKWVELSQFAEGNLSSYRKASFWTPYSLRRTKLPRDMAKVGVPSDWIWKNGVILRLDLAEFLASGLIVRVPTTVDGYTYPVFHPRREKIKPAWGTAIDINRQPLTLGQAEVVVPPAPVSLFKIRPVRIPGESKKNISELLDLLAPLEQYYDSL